MDNSDDANSPCEIISRIIEYKFEAVKFDEKAVDKSMFSLSGAEIPNDIFSHRNDCKFLLEILSS